MMTKRLLLILFIFTFATAQAQEEQAAEKPKPLDPEYMGEHKMVLVNNGSNLLAYFLPTYEKPNNAQLVYSISSKTNAVTHLVRDADLVTAKSSAFNLQRLHRAEEEVPATMKVYMGSIDDGGMPIYEEVDVIFEEQMYFRPFESLASSSVKRVYDEIPLKGDARILIHQIQSSPSYDHLVLVYENQGCMTQFVSSSPIPPEGEILNRFVHCGSMKPLYYDTQRLQ
ncbi:hypothetical protein OE749_07595 [Aestuariibacter sp. AA17]|uniref:Uncharacterized protein n=1 Tax=Fluctibacter corallii TaxID=2984329 RepID=A0ABT3A7C6_9ALTE|nr:hypothetical protein [Aestuariibacter sp. AA17]MCV2884554.1 hypothetical protein [Aestuariibacter sp. AA17]